MDKDLEKEYLEDLDHYDEGMGIHSTSYAKCKERLIRLAKIDNANPSEAMEMLKGIEYVADVLKVNHKIGSRNIANQEIKEMVDRLNYRIPTIKQALLKAQEQEKVLKIIMEKGLDYHSLSAIKQAKDFEEFKELTENLITKFLDYTQEEFDLLKRYCNEEKD